jgi:hypothetical protein
MSDVLNITILSDGTIKSETVGHVSAPNHQSAEAFLKEVSRLAGGEVTRQKRGHTHGHQHQHGGHEHGQ